MGVIRLAVDAMGGDYAPTEIVAGVVEGARDFDLHLILVGDPDTIHQETDWGKPVGKERW